MIMGTRLAAAVRAFEACPADHRASVLNVLQDSAESGRAMLQGEHDPSVLAQLTDMLGVQPTPEDFAAARVRLAAFTAAIELLRAAQGDS